MALVMLALPGAVFIYNGEELGLANVELPDEALRDPVWERSGHTRRGRDGSRVPVPWEGKLPVRLLRQPRYMAATTAGVVVAHRREAAAGPQFDVVVLSGGTATTQQPKRIRRHRGRMAGRARRTRFRLWVTGGLVCALNAGDTPVALPAGEVLLASGEIVDGALPPNTAAWLV